MCSLYFLAESFVNLEDCDYVLAARYKDYTQHVTRTSNVVQDIFKNKDQWQTVNED